MTHLMLPLSSGRSLIQCDLFFHRETAGENFQPEDAIEFWDMTNRQDWHVCELGQQGISSRAYAPGLYPPRESLPAAWDREYLLRLG